MSELNWILGHPVGVRMAVGVEKTRIFVARTMSRNSTLRDFFFPERIFVRL